MQLTYKTIDRREIWDAFLDANSPYAFFQSWEWGDVQEKTGQTVYRLGFFDGDQMVGIAQVFVVRARRGVFLHFRHGPVWRTQKSGYWKQLVDLMRPIGRSEHALFLRISPLIDPSDTINNDLHHIGYRNAPIHAMDAEHCWVLDIDKPEESLLGQMRKTTRYEIRHAQKLGIQVTATDNPQKLHDFNALYDETSKRHGFVGHQGIDEEFRVLSREKKILLYLASYEEKIIAGAIIVFCPNQAIYHHGASVTSKIPASYLIQWEAIREAKKRGLKLYNFWGIADSENINHPWRGITLFKKGFGGREVGHIHALDYAFSPLYIIPKSIETVRRIMRGY